MAGDTTGFVKAPELGYTIVIESDLGYKDGG